MGSIDSTNRREPASDRKWLALRVVGAGLLFATGAIHLDLYLTGYRTLPTIGWLFLLQVISDAILAGTLVVSDGRPIAAAGAGLFLSTLVGYLVALRFGLFGFREVRTTAGVAAGAIEIVGFAALATFALRPYGDSLTSRKVQIRAARWVAVVATILAALSLGLSLANAGAASTTSNGSSAVLKVGDVHGVAVLTNDRGYTLYWFAPDTSTASHCYGACAAYWPPAIGSPTTGASVVGSFSTVRRAGGAVQVTYNGHPLYTYVGDSAPGQANGNDIRLNGGWWYEMKVAK
jgi:predicted lipoprotein with Yx(FWY)xxD motif